MRAIYGPAEGKIAEFNKKAGELFEAVEKLPKDKTGKIGKITEASLKFKSDRSNVVIGIILNFIAEVLELELEWLTNNRFTEALKANNAKTEISSFTEYLENSIKQPQSLIR
jgi:hypothetical protein